MKIRLQHITPADQRATPQLATGEIVENEVELDADGQSRTFTVYLKADVLPDVDASIVYGEDLLEELLRFEPAALSKLYRAVAKRRRGEVLALPLVLVEEEPEPDELSPVLKRLVIKPQTL